jgi:hypothetical protein
MDFRNSAYIIVKNHGLRESEFSEEIEKLQNKSALSRLLKKFTQSVSFLLENAIRPLLHIHSFIAKHFLTAYKSNIS